MKLFNRNSYGDPISPTINLFLVIILWIFWIILFFSSWFTVSPWERAFVVMFWHIWNEVYDSWFHLKNPLWDTVKINVQSQKHETVATAASKDLQDVTTNVSVNWNVIPLSVRNIKIVYGDADNLEMRLLQPSIQDSIKASTSLFTAEELITKRDEVSSIILKNLKDKVITSWIEITWINITEFKFSPSFSDSIELKVKAWQDAQRAKADLVRIEFEGKQKVVTANAERDAAIAKAQWTAEAIKIQAEAIKANWWSEYIELRKIEAWEKWGSQVPQIITNWSSLINIPALK